jgi:hypothetical protein
MGCFQGVGWPAVIAAPNENTAPVPIQVVIGSQGIVLPLAVFAGHPQRFQSGIEMNTLFIRIGRNQCQP